MNTKNIVDIQDVLKVVKETAPKDASVTFDEIAGNIAIILSNGTEVLFGNSLDNEIGYTWSDCDIEGYNRNIGAFDDLGEAEAIVKEFWGQLEMCGL